MRWMSDRQRCLDVSWVAWEWFCTDRMFRSLPARQSRMSKPSPCSLVDTVSNPSPTVDGLLHPDEAVADTVTVASTVPSKSAGVHRHALGAPLLSFLQALAHHNNRSWMREQADRHRTDVLLPLQRLLRDVVSRVGEQVPGAGAGPHEAVVLRMRRDARFVGTGDPFRPYSGIQVRHRASLPGAPAPALTVRLQPGLSRISVGLVRAAPGSMRSIRAAMMGRPDLWLTVAHTLEESGGGWSEDIQRRLTGKERAAPSLAPYLARGNQAFCWPLSDQAVAEEDLLPTIVRAVRLGAPLLRFQCLAMGLDPGPGGLSRLLYRADHQVLEQAGGLAERQR